MSGWVGKHFAVSTSLEFKTSVRRDESSKKKLNLPVNPGKIECLKRSYFIVVVLSRKATAILFCS